MTLGECRCGGSPLRLRKRTRKGRRWLVMCSRCGKRTHLHRANGGEIAEWEEMR